MKPYDTGLALPFPVPADLRSVVTVAYRNSFRTRSAIITTDAGRFVVCEHGKRKRFESYSDGLLWLEAPTFCPECVTSAK